MDDSEINLSRSGLFMEHILSGKFLNESLDNSLEHLWNNSYINKRSFKAVRALFNDSDFRP